MKLHRTNFFVGTLVVLSLLGTGYYYYNEDASRFLREFLNQLQPCQRPITYSIANFDQRFSLTQAELLNYIKQAEKIWESPISKQLFEYSPTGDLRISFVYDYRQKATDELKKMGIIVNDDRTTYDALKAKYNLLIVSYNQEKARIDVLIAAYNADKIAFDKGVNFWNNRGGAPEAEYNIFQQKRANLNNQVEIINQAKNSLNGLVDIINSTELVLNKLVATLNLKVAAYNTIGASAGKEFNEGEYVRDASGTAINIFQFNDKSQLMRVLAHELGHALDLEHIDNPKAIMYYLNEGVNEKLTADDLAALKKQCEIN